jgi:hypothetical protein
VTIPEGAEADAVLERSLVRWVARAKWNEPGYYRIVAVQSAEVKRAVEAFERAETLLK